MAPPGKKQTSFNTGMQKLTKQKIDEAIKYVTKPTNMHLNMREFILRGDMNKFDHSHDMLPQNVKLYVK